MIDFNILYDDVDTIRAIRATALANLSQGILITQWASEGSTFQGVANCNTAELLLATERYLDEYNGNLITETRPNFLSLY
jgi:hypothetical protein